MVEIHLDWMAAIKAVWPLLAVLSGEAPHARREITVSSDATRAASQSSVLPPLVFLYKGRFIKTQSEVEVIEGMDGSM